MQELSHCAVHLVSACHAFALEIQLGVSFVVQTG